MTIDHSDRKHSRFGASGAHRWFACPGSVQLCAGIEDRPSAWALEGTEAHETLQFCLERGCPSIDPAVQVALDYIWDILDEHSDAAMLVEQQFMIPIDIAPSEVFGTCDAVIYVPSMRLMYVIDYKHGAGVPVRLAGNKQTQFYAAGALFQNVNWVVDTVALVIIQPRVFDFALPIPEEWVPVSKIMDFYGEIEEHIRAAQAPDAPLVAGEEQCRFCPAATICPAREKMALAVVSDAFSDVQQVTASSLPAVTDLTPERIGHVLAMRDLVQDWFTQVYDRGLELARQGVAIPGRKVVEAQARRQWDGDPEDISLELWQLSNWRIDREEFFPPTLLGITKAEKLLKDCVRENAPPGKKKTAVEALTKALAQLTTKRSSGKLSLVAEDDNRPAVDATRAAFGDAVSLLHVTDGDGE